MHDDDKDYSDFTDKLTIEEVAHVDDEMVRDAIKNAHRFVVYDKLQALKLFGDALVRSLEHVGVKNPLQFIEDSSRQIDCAGSYTRGPVRMERRTRYTGNDMWRNGVYVFSRGELAYFVSEPMQETPHPLGVYRADHRFGINLWTNAPFHKKIRSFHGTTADGIPGPLVGPN